MYNTMASCYYFYATFFSAGSDALVMRRGCTWVHVYPLSLVVHPLKEAPPILLPAPVGGWFSPCPPSPSPLLPPPLPPAGGRPAPTASRGMRHSCSDVPKTWPSFIQLLSATQIQINCKICVPINILVMSDFKLNLTWLY